MKMLKNFGSVSKYLGLGYAVLRCETKGFSAVFDLTVLHNRRSVRSEIFLRRYSIPKSNFTVQLDKDIESGINEKKFKSRKHPGVMTTKCIQLPALLIDAVNEVIRDYPSKPLYADATKLFNYIQSRLPQLENSELEEKKKNFRKKIDDEELPHLLDHSSLKEDEDVLGREERVKLNKILSAAVHNRKPIEYTQYVGTTYLVARLAPDFASLVSIFEEIKKRCKEFQPKSFFDFGSGVGSGFWALNNVWPDVCEEGYFVDSSSAMNELAERLMKGGNPESKYIVSPVKSCFFRQFLPASTTLQYDIVLSSRTLYEIGQLRDRAQTIDILWRKVRPGGFLVLVENKSMASYRMLMELRDFLIQVNESKRKLNKEVDPIHVFAPCPHDMFCPRFFHISNTSCHFTVKYLPPNTADAKNEQYSYVVFQKAHRSGECNWPRIVQPVLPRHHHVVLRTCTPDAAIKAFVVTKQKHGTSCYQVCKKSSWGDLLPVNFLPSQESCEEGTMENNCNLDEQTSVDDKKVLHPDVDVHR